MATHDRDETIIVAHLDLGATACIGPTVTARVLAIVAPTIATLGAGFAGLELATLLSEHVDGAAEITLVDDAAGFVFGFSKLDVMFRGADEASVLLPYDEFVKPGVRFLRERVLAIDPEARTVETSAGTLACDVLVIALRRPDRARRHRLPDWPIADRRLPRTLGRTSR